MSAPSRLRTTLLWLGLFALALLLLRFGWNPEPSAPIVPDQFQGAPEVTGPVVESWAAAGELSSLVYSSEGYYWAVLIDGGAYALVGDIDPSLPNRLMSKGFPVLPLEAFRGELEPPGILDPGLDPSFVLILALLIGIIAFVVYYRKRQAGAVGSSITALRQSKMRRLEEPSHLRFSDVGGMEDIKLRLGDMVSFLRQPQLWAGSGARPPLGILLEGPPGCGKTLLARAVAGEAGVPVFVMSGSELVEMFVGVGAARVRDTFEQARNAAPAVLFIDELDAVGRRRGSGISQLTNDEREHTLNQLLVCLDGAEKGGLSKLAVLAATNRADILDPALLRAGRFDLRLTVKLPDLASRAAILSIHCRHLQLAPQVDLGHLAEQTDGLSGAELELLCNEAAVQAARRSIAEKRTSLVSPDDLALGLAQARHASENLGPLDSLLIDSASQICKPRRPLWVTIELEGGGGATGELLWADPTWLKLRPSDGSPERILARRAIFGISQCGATEEEFPQDSPTFDLYPRSLPGTPRGPSRTPDLAAAGRPPPPDVFGSAEPSPSHHLAEPYLPGAPQGVGPEEAPRGPHR